ncbi:MAG TPA: adenosine deaminase, partial [Patescibacteria group bacterium]|nr:adenosine deaminase [Patescibacteria group bacterium]
GHGFLAWQDKNLLKELKRRQIVLELCPTSNLRCGVIPSVAKMRKIYQTLAEGGVGLTINTDGPEMYKTNLYKELEFLKDNKIFSQSQLNEFMRNAFRASFIK